MKNLSKSRKITAIIMILLAVSYEQKDVVLSLLPEAYQDAAASLLKLLIDLLILLYNG